MQICIIPGMEHSHLIVLAERLAHHLGRSEATVSNWIVGHARLFSRLREGRGTTVRTYHRALQWFSSNWPVDLVWPSDIPRPAPAAPDDLSAREVA